MERTTNIRRIADRLKRHPLLADLSFESIIEYTTDFIQIVGVPRMFVDKVETIEIKDYRGLLPCDYVFTIQVREVPLKDDISTVFRYTTDSFHLSENKPKIGTGGTDLTYKIQGSIIYTSIKDGKIELSYRAMAVDKEGLPLLPDNPSFLRALEAFIKKSYFTIQFDLGKLNGSVLQNAQREYAWAVGDCENEFKRLDLDKAESLFNSWRTLFIRDREHSHGFLNDGTKEFLKVH